MTREEILNSLTEIGTCEDDVSRRSLLTAVRDEISSVFDTNDSLTESNNKYIKDNDELRSANMQLFLRVSGGQQSTPMDNNGTETKSNLKYEDLFNEKGELK